MIVRVIVTTEELDDMQLSTDSLAEQIELRLNTLDSGMCSFIIDIEEHLDE